MFQRSSVGSRYGTGMAAKPSHLQRHCTLDLFTSFLWVLRIVMAFGLSVRSQVVEARSVQFNDKGVCCFSFVFFLWLADPRSDQVRSSSLKELNGSPAM